MNVLYEDNHLLVLNKMPGELVQGDKTGDESLFEQVKLYIKKKYNKPGAVYLGLPHRIDRPTSGLVMFARTSKALERINRILQEKKDIKKIYWAVVDAPPPAESGELVHHLAKNESKNKSFTFDRPTKKSKEARLKYKLIGATKKYYLVEIELITGRHHQIRAQFASVGCHIKGDLKYGASRSNQNGGIHLHARRLELLHPVKKETIKVVADPPIDPVWNEFMKINFNH